MSKYIDLGKVKELVFNADMSMAETEALYKSLDNLPTIEVSEDCISREWMFKNYQTVCENVICSECPFDSDDCRLVDFITHAPSVVPSRAEGEWIYIDEPIIGNPYGRYRCSKCEMEKPHETDYCPNCGAKMRLE